MQRQNYRRIVVVDIETIPLDNKLENAALDAMTGRIVCIGLLIEDKDGTTESVLMDQDERKLLKSFWEMLRPTDLLIGHNLLEFDLPFIRQRSWICGVRPSRTIDMRRFYTVEVVDTLQLWTNWGYKKGATLDNLGRILNCGQKLASGGDVGTWWAAGDYDSIRRYCLEDVRITYRIYCRLTYRQPAEPSSWPRLEQQRFAGL